MKNNFLVPGFILGLLFVSTSTAAMKIELHSSLTRDQGYGNCRFETNGELDVIKYRIKEGDTVFDVGANKGEWSQAVYKRHHEVFLYSFEPLVRLNSLLNANLKSTGAETFCVALSDSCGELDFIEYDNETTLSSFYDRPILSLLPHHTVKVATTTLDVFCQEHEISCIDFLKIDTEGNEHKVLLGAQNMLRSGLIKQIQFEYGGTYLDSETTLKAVFHLLHDHGYKIYRIAKGMLIYIDSWDDSLENFKYSNYLACLE